MSNTAYGLGALASAFYAISGTFSKVASTIDTKLGEIPKDEMTLGETTSLGLAIGAGLTVAGLTKLINCIYTESKNPQTNSWLFQRLK